MDVDLLGGWSVDETPIDFLHISVWPRSPSKFRSIVMEAGASPYKFRWIWNESKLYFLPAVEQIVLADGGI